MTATQTRKTNDETANRAARQFMSGTNAAERMEFDIAWKHFEASISLYRKAGREEDAAYVEAKCREEGY